MFESLRRTIARIRTDERGAGLVEYTLLVALIALVCFGALSFVGGSNGGGIDRSASCITAAMEGQPRPENCPD